MRRARHARLRRVCCCLPVGPPDELLLEMGVGTSDTAMGNLEAAAKKAEAAIVPALDLIDAAKGEDARLAAQLGLEDRAVELAEALEAKHFSDDATLPPKCSFSDVDTLPRAST
jgi:hypothetical protein